MYANLRSATLALSLVLAACSPQSGLDHEDLQGADESVSDSSALSGSIPVGSKLRTTANLNLRKGPSTSQSIKYTMPEGSTVTVEESAPSNGFYRVKHNGTLGWAFGQYLDVVDTPEVDDGETEDGETDDVTSSSRDAAIARAKVAVGFSYWWGHGRFAESGATASNKGSCSGSCPNCSHSGSYGGDCSGLAAKVWQVPSSNTTLSVDSHPYSTADFVKDSSQWYTVPRSNMEKADMMVYRQNGAGHIFVYESGDGWGSMYAYECKGCSAGCIEGLRTAGSAYKGIRRSGY
jgi:hypothetical protein